MCYTCTVYFPSVALPVGDVFLWFIVAFSLEFVTWCPVKQLANICKPLSLSNQNVFNVEVKFESFYGQTFNLKVLILKEHVRKHGPKKCARKPFWTVLCRKVQKNQIVLNRSEPFPGGRFTETVLNRSLRRDIFTRKPFWTVLCASQSSVSFLLFWIVCFNLFFIFGCQVFVSIWSTDWTHHYISNPVMSNECNSYPII